MPQEEVFLELQDGIDTIRVVKTYDAAFAKECFDAMDELALKTLADSLSLEESYDVVDIPSASDNEYADFLWQEMFDSAKEDGQTRSFFVVTTSKGNRVQPIYVSADWPSAEAYAKHPREVIAD